EIEPRQRAPARFLHQPQHVERAGRARLELRVEVEVDRRERRGRRVVDAYSDEARARTEYDLLREGRRRMQELEVLLPAAAHLAVVARPEVALVERVLLLARRRLAALGREVGVALQAAALRPARAERADVHAQLAALAAAVALRAIDEAFEAPEVQVEEELVEPRRQPVRAQSHEPRLSARQVRAGRGRRGLEPEAAQEPREPGSCRRVGRFAHRRRSTSARKNVAPSTRMIVAPGATFR